METGAGGELSNGGSGGKLGYFDALKVVAAPLATLAGVFGLIFYFAAGAWVSSIARAEIEATVTTADLNENTLIAHTGKLEQHDEEIEDNEEDIEKNRSEFQQFIREVIAKL